MASPEFSAEPSGSDGEAKTATYYIGAAEITFEGLFAPDSMKEAVDESWKAGHTRKLYNRLWRITKVLETNGIDTFYGKIGFVNPQVENAVEFDPETMDFVLEDLPSGAVVPFKISGNRLVYQILPGTVREATFIRAFTEIMNSGNEVQSVWNLTPLSYEVEYQSWIEAIERVTKFDFRLEPPNPHYGDDEIVEQLVEGLKSDFVRLSGSSSKGDGVDTDSEPFQQALDHVIRNYGRATLTGVDHRDVESVWTKVQRKAARTLARVTVKSPGGTEAPQEVLDSALRELAVGAMPTHLDEIDDESFT